MPKIPGRPDPEVVARRATASTEQRIRHTIEEAFATRLNHHIGDHAAEIAALVMEVVGEPFPTPELCTYGGDCALHPDVKGLHNFDATARGVLLAVLAAVKIRPEFGVHDVYAIAAHHRIELERVVRF